MSSVDEATQTQLRNIEAQTGHSLDELIAAAEALYDAYQLDALPPALRRNSLDYYYLSIYPSLGEMRPLAEENAPPYPATVRNAYVHIPVSYTHLTLPTSDLV